MNFSRSAKLAAPLILAVLGTACTGSSVSIPTAPSTVTTTTTDPTGDAFLPGAGATAWDITQVATSRLASGATSLNVSVTFVQPISAASLPANGGTLSPAGTQLGNLILLDTGIAGGITDSPGPACVGSPIFPNVNFLVGPGLGAFLGSRLADGNYPILNASFAQVGEAAVSFTGPNTISYSIPLAAIGGGSGSVQLAVLSVDGLSGSGGGITDCAPNNSYVTT